MKRFNLRHQSEPSIKRPKLHSSGWEKEMNLKGAFICVGSPAAILQTCLELGIILAQCDFLQINLPDSWHTLIWTIVPTLWPVFERLAVSDNITLKFDATWSTRHFKVQRISGKNLAATWALRPEQRRNQESSSFPGLSTCLLSVLPVQTPRLLVSVVVVRVCRDLLHPHHGSFDAALQLVISRVLDFWMSRNHLQRDRRAFIELSVPAELNINFFLKKTKKLSIAPWWLTAERKYTHPPLVFFFYTAFTFYKTWCLNI